jgi:hypothetical protein
MLTQFRLHATAVIGYTYEAAHHCPECARKRFTETQLQDPFTCDRHGDPIRAIFASDLSDDPYMACDDCLEYLD